MSHGSYNRLFSSIIHSTVWQEPMPTKIVWVTMLAMADSDGRVRVSVPGLARAAGVTMQDCLAALDCFRSPDPHSTSKELNGRRIRDLDDGGWELVTFADYRERASSEATRVKAAERAKRYRDRHAAKSLDTERKRAERAAQKLSDSEDASRLNRDGSSRSMTNASDPDPDPDPEPDPEGERERPPRVTQPTSPGDFGTNLRRWVAGVRKAFPKFIAPLSRAHEEWIRKAVDTHSPTDPGAWLEAKAEEFARKADPRRYRRVPYGFVDWLNDGQPDVASPPAWKTEPEIPRVPEFREPKRRGERVTTPEDLAKVNAALDQVAPPTTVAKGEPMPLEHTGIRPLAPSRPQTPEERAEKLRQDTEAANALAAKWAAEGGTDKP